MQSDPLALLTRMRETQGDVVQVRFGPRLVVFVFRPELAGHVLVDNLKNYEKQTRGYAMLRKVLGRGLLTSEGETWKRHRRIAQPAFNRKRVADFADVMVRVTRDRIESRWVEAERTGDEIDVADEMMRMTLQIVSETMLGIGVGGAADVVARTLPIVLEHVLYRTTHPLSPPNLVPTHRNRVYRRALSELDGVVAGIVRQRREGTGPDRPDLLQMLLTQVDEETGARMNDRQLRDEVMTMYLAGHETTALALTWTFHELSKQPGWAARLRQEVDTVLGSRAATMADLPRLDVVRRVIEETMRLHPPVWLLARKARDADELGGFSVDAGTMVFVSPWAIHRHPEVWTEPERFDPDRFLPERRERLPKHAYLPFSAGQRKCIGDHFAMMEATLVFATILQHFEVRLVSEQRIEPHCAVTLRPRFGLRAHLQRRERELALAASG